MTERDLQPLGNEVDWLMRNELASVEQAYESGDILGVPAHCLIGTEIDFTISNDSPTSEQQTALEASRDTIVTELSLLVPKNEEQQRRKAEWLGQIPHLTPQELITYHIYRRLSVPTLNAPDTAMYLQADESPETTLEFKFGQGLYQTGYYDAPGRFEMRTQAAKPTIATERVWRAITIGHETARSFGRIFSYRGDHTNFSVWVLQEGGLRSLHSLHTPEGQEIARRATAGMLHALRDSTVAFYTPTAHSMPQEEHVRLVADSERKGMLRVVPGRFEQRRRAGEGNHVLASLVLASGFAYGVTEPQFDTGFVHKQQRALLVPGLGYNKTRDLYLLRALQASQIVDGRFVFGTSELYVSRHEGMLSSIVGTEVYGLGSSWSVIGNLLGSISLTPEGVLEADEQAFEDALNQAINDRHISVVGTPNESITERLQRIKCMPNTATITGSVEYEWPSGVTLHRNLEQFVSAPSLRYIREAVREAVRQKHAAEFTHEDAVSRYCVKKIAQVLLPVSEKVTRLQELTSQFPEVEESTLSELIQEELRQTLARLAQAMAVNEAMSEDDPAKASPSLYGDWQEQHDDALALLRALER